MAAEPYILDEERKHPAELKIKTTWSKYCLRLHFSFFILLSISVPFVKWTSVHCARDWHLLSSNPLAAWQDYKQPPEMQASVLGKDIYVSHLDPLSSLCCVFPGCWNADYTAHSIQIRNQTFPLCFSLSRCFLSILAGRTSLYSPHVAFYLCLYKTLGAQRYVAAWVVALLVYSLTCIVAWLQLIVCLRCLDNVRQQHVVSV